MRTLLPDRNLLAFLLVLAIIGAVLGGVAAGRITADEDGSRGQSRSPEHPLAQGDPRVPRVYVESGTAAVDECFFTTQKELEGPVRTSEPDFGKIEEEARRAAEELFQQLLEQGVPKEEAERRVDEFFHEFVERAMDEGRFTRDVLKEIEIIKVISACVNRGEDGSVQPSEGVEVFITQCTKEVDLRAGHCNTHRGHFEEPGPTPTPTPFPSLPDLIVRLPEPTRVECPEGPESCIHEVSWVVFNRGAAGSGPTQLEIGTHNGLGWRDSIPGLPPGGQVGGVAVLGPGTDCYSPDCHLEAMVDPDNGILELNEENNVTSRIDLG